MYILAPNQIIEQYPYSLQALREAHPNVSFPRVSSAELLAEYGVFFVVGTGGAQYDPMTHKQVEGTPTLVEGQWRQTWEIVPLTVEELAARIPTSVSPRQARLALLGAGLLPLVQTALEALDEPMKSAALIEWEYATTIDRGSNLVTALGGSLGLTEAQLDGLFIAAATL